MRMLAFWLLLSASCCGQISSSATTLYKLSGIDGWHEAGSVLLVPQGSKPTVAPVGVLTIDCDASQKIIRVSDAARRPVQTEQATASTWLIHGQGKVWIDITCVDFDKQIFEVDQLTLEITSTPGPDPDPDTPDPPDPNVPEDPFDNIGQRVRTWSAGLPSNAAWSAAYQKWSQALLDNPGLTVSSAAQELVNELSRAPGFAEYAAIREKLNTDLASRWPMSKGTLSDYWAAIARGFQ